jgi:lactate racemase-like protein
VKIPVLSGSRVAVVNAPDDALVLRPPPPLETVVEIGAAVRDAVRFPLAGEPLETLVSRGGRATIVLDHPSLPLPSAQADPRQEALFAVVDELERLGVPSQRQTLLVAGGLERKAGRRERERLGTPELGRRFHGRVEVHDVEDPGLGEIGSIDGIPLAVNPLLLETDLVVTLTAAETVLQGGAAALLAAGGPHALREAAATSLLEATGSRGWDLGLVLERALAARVPLLGISLVLDHPRLGGALRGFPDDRGVAERLVRSPLASGFRMLPSFARRQILRSVPVELKLAAAYAGPPSVAHAEALLRAVEARSVDLEGKLDAICIGIGPSSAHLPREKPNPLLAAYLGLGIALRLWRDDFPVVEGGTAILVHHFNRRFPGSQRPYRRFFAGRQDEQEVARDPDAVAAYRAGRSAHPLLPFADWEACAPALERLGAVLVAECRDAAAARRLGFVPTHGVSAALDMARGRAGRDPRIGFILSPPYFPLVVRG